MSANEIMDAISDAADTFSSVANRVYLGSDLIRELLTSNNPCIECKQDRYKVMGLDIYVISELGHLYVC
jgi:hypothetical protein